MNRKSINKKSRRNSKKKSLRLKKMKGLGKKAVNDECKGSVFGSECGSDDKHGNLKCRSDEGKVVSRGVKGVCMGDKTAQEKRQAVLLKKTEECDGNRKKKKT